MNLKMRHFERFIGYILLRGLSNCRMDALNIDRGLNSMIRLMKMLSGLCVVLTVTANAASTDDTVIPSTETGALSYSMGYKTGQALKTQSVTIDPYTFSNGLKAGYQGLKPVISDETMQASLSKMQKQMVQKMQSQYKDQAEKNAKDGQEFLAKNAKLPNVRTTDSGLQYQVVREGEGD